MAINDCPSLLLLVFIILTAISGTAIPASSDSDSPSLTESPSPLSDWQGPIELRQRRSRSSRRPRPRPSPAEAPAVPEAPAPTTEEQMNNIIDALIGSGDFGNWADLISGAILPFSATLFVPENDAVPAAANAALPGVSDPFLLPYHVVPQRLTFQELLLFKTETRLPTLLPGRSIVITNNSRLNFTIDGSPITLPDLYATTSFTIHGISAVFNYSAYGGDTEQLDTRPNHRPEESQVVRAPPAHTPGSGEVSSASSADPPCFCIELPVFLVAVCVVLRFKIHRNNLISKP